MELTEHPDDLARRVIDDDAHIPSLGRDCGFGGKKGSLLQIVINDAQA
jgi:hypothetical protein